MKLSQNQLGFSLIELLIALTITLTIGAAIFQVFQQSEHVFRDEQLMIEMQQNARAVASQITDEVRMAGAGTPAFAATFDNNNYEATTAILGSSTADRIDFRAGLSNTETNVTTSLPLDFTLGTSQAVTVGDGTVFSASLRTTTPTGKFAYIWGPTDDSGWAWVRAELIQISSSTMTLTPRQAGDKGRLPGTDNTLGTADDVIRFLMPPTLSLEEVVSFSFNGSSVRRATATNMTNPASPIWSPANEIGRNFESLNFTYYDQNNDPVDPTSPTAPAARATIVRVDFTIVAHPASKLSYGELPSYTVAERTILRNAKLR